MESTLVLTLDAQQKVLEIIFARADALNVYWNFYIAVGLGVLGLMASGKPFTEERRIKILLTVAFIVFAYSNYNAISEINAQRLELIALLKSSVYLPAAIHATPPNQVILKLFHGALDLLILLVIWLVPWHRSSATENAA